jgi:hypothetical protein
MVRCEAPRVKTRHPVSTAPRGAARTSAVLLPVISFSSPLGHDGGGVRDPNGSIRKPLDHVDRDVDAATSMPCG